MSKDDFDLTIRLDEENESTHSPVIQRQEVAEPQFDLTISLEDQQEKACQKEAIKKEKSLVLEIDDEVEETQGRESRISSGTFANFSTGKPAPIVDHPEKIACKENDQSKITFYDPEERIVATRNAWLGALVVGIFGALCWAGFQAGALGTFPRFFVCVVALFSTAGAGLGGMRDFETVHIATISAVVCIILAIATTGFVTSQMMHNLVQLQQRELANNYGITKSLDEIGMWDFVVGAFSPFDIIPILIGIALAFRYNREARW